MYKYTYQMKYMHVWHICQLKSKGLDGRGHFKALFISFKWRALLMKIKKNVQISKHRNLDFFLYKIIINCQKYHIQKFKVDLMVHLLTINWSLLKRTKLNSRSSDCLGKERNLKSNLSTSWSNIITDFHYSYDFKKEITQFHFLTQKFKTWVIPLFNTATLNQ